MLVPFERHFSIVQTTHYCIRGRVEGGWLPEVQLKTQDRIRKAKYDGQVLVIKITLFFICVLHFKAGLCYALIAGSTAVVLTKYIRGYVCSAHIKKQWSDRRSTALHTEDYPKWQS